MKALYIYNPYNAQEITLIERVKSELWGYVQVVPIDEAPNLIRSIVRETPALISADEHLQGENLIKDGVDGKLLLTAIMYQRMEADEDALFDQSTVRLDNFVKGENTKAIDHYTLELVDGGII